MKNANKLKAKLVIEIPGAAFMHVAVFHHCKENTVRVKFSKFKVPLYSFLIPHCQEN